MSTIDLEKLIELVEAATRKLDVCVPCRDFYRRREDWSEDEIEYIDAGAFLEGLRELAKGQP